MLNAVPPDSAACRAFRRRKLPASGAFSLLELLAVIAIITLLSAASIAAFNAITRARGVTESAYQISSALELARSEAVIRQTYVWVGFQPQTNAGNRDLRVGIVYSMDGSSTNTTAGNLAPLGKAILLPSTALSTSAVLITNRPLIDLFSNTAGITFTLGQTTFTNRCSLTFMPLGEVTVAASPATTDGFDPLLGIGLRQTRGTNVVTTTNNDVAVGIDGSVGVPFLKRVNLK